MAPVTNYEKLRSLKKCICYFTVLEVGILKWVQIKLLVGLRSFLGALGEKSSVAFSCFQRPPVFLTLWLHHSNLCFCDFLFSNSASFFFIRTPVMALDLHIVQNNLLYLKIFNLIASVKFLLPYEVT